MLCAGWNLLKTEQFCFKKSFNLCDCNVAKRTQRNMTYCHIVETTPWCPVQSAAIDIHLGYGVMTCCTASVPALLDFIFYLPRLTEYQNAIQSISSSHWSLVGLLNEAGKELEWNHQEHMIKDERKKEEAKSKGGNRGCVHPGDWMMY